MAEIDALCEEKRRLMRMRTVARNFDVEPAVYSSEAMGDVPEATHTLSLSSVFHNYFLTMNMAITKWEPRRELDTVHRSLRRMFEDFDTNFLGLTPFTNQGTFMPMVDINEDTENLYFVFDLPGLKSEDVKITVSDGILTIRGEKKREEEESNRNFYRMERSHGEFVRQFTLPEDIKEEDIQANFDSGVLKVLVPKKEPAKPKEREVRISSGNGSTVPQSNGKGTLKSSPTGSTQNVEVRDKASSHA